jgi:hypothetical protein
LVSCTHGHSDQEYLPVLIMVGLGYTPYSSIAEESPATAVRNHYRAPRTLSSHQLALNEHY